MAKNGYKKLQPQLRKEKLKESVLEKNLEVKAVRQVPDAMLLLKRLQKWQEREKQLSVIKSFFS